MQVHRSTGFTVSKFKPEIDVCAEFLDEDSNHRLFSSGDGGKEGSVTDFGPEGFVTTLSGLSNG